MEKQISWIKGKSYEEAYGKSRSDLLKKKISESRIKKLDNPLIECSCGCGSKFKMYDSSWRIRKFVKGHSSRLMSIKTKEKMSIFRKGKCRPKFSESWIRNLSLSHLGYKQKKQHIRNILRRKIKSSLEIKFENIVTKLGLPYTFVGNGKVIIARKCPDFINSNGKKLAIEVYYKKHKDMFRNGLDNWKAERIKIFNENGWDIIFFDENQVNENNIKETLGEIKS